MGVFDERTDDIITIRDEKNWEPHEQCEARTVVKVSDYEWVQGQLVKIKQAANSSRRGAFQKDAQVDIQSQTGASDRLWVFRMLKSWTFTKGGQPMPLTLEAVRLLPQSVLNFIYNRIQEAQPQEEGEEAAELRGEGEDPTTSDALPTIDGDMNEADEDTSLSPEAMNASRNFLSR